MDTIRENHKELAKINKLISKSHQLFRGIKHNAFTQEVNKLALSASNNNGMQPIDSIETYLWRDSKVLMGKKEDTRCNKIIKQHKYILNVMMLQKKT